ncbi:trigger factor [Limimonas halophila]|uniref:Trigger factor n=1 Tax=Limimonas halophila TaxID=1082479 RepID=A0A1G7N5Z5_9PROT|nr:trigger factor [Limimonas halophila]SDF69485.1 trigger factor [Limimonas halophila]
MQVTETHADGLKRQYKVVVDKNDIDQRIQDRLNELGQEAQIPGFRKGKAPISLLRQRFGRAVQGEVLEKAVNETSQQALQEQGVQPAGQPQIEVQSFEEGQDLEYTMDMELLPEIEPMDFTQLELERLKVSIPDSEVDQALERLAEQYKGNNPISEDRPAQNGDVVVIDFRGQVDGEEHPALSGEDQYVELGAGQMIGTFEEQLVGASQGEEREVRITFPEDIGNEQFAGKEAVFTVTVKEIREPEPAEVNEELAQKLGSESLDALRQSVREQLQQEYDQLARQRTKRELLDKLAENHTFDVPPSMVEQEFDQIWKQIEQDREQGKLDAEDAEKSEDELKADYRQIAERRVRLGLLLSEVGRENNVEVSQDELNKAVLEEVQRHRGHEREVFEYYQNNPDAVQQLRAPLYEEKTIDFILERANVSEREVTPDQLHKELGDSDESESA